MKRKILLAFTFLTLINQKSFAQDYIPMLNNSSWNIAIASMIGIQNSVINELDETVIGSFTYHTFLDTSTNMRFFIREDIDSKRVYRNIEGNDQLLFDFSLEVSNSIILDGSNYTVSLITTTIVNGGTRKLFVVNNGFFTDYWIEGVGSKGHPFKHRREMPSDPYIYLTCSAQNGVNVYNYGLANGQTTPTDCSMLLSNEEINNLKQNINFSPNPFKTELFISTKLNLENATLKIYNSIGQLVKEIKNIYGQKITVNRESLSNGIYIVKLFENEKILTTNKIILSD